VRLPAAALLVLASAFATPAQAQLQHGSNKGEGDSRGSGRGDGLGYERETGQPKPVPEKKPTPEPAQPNAAQHNAAERSIFDSVSFVPTMQYRVRYYHLEHRDFAPGSSNFVRHRARLGLSATYDNSVGVVVELQDVRTWGEESDVVADFNADGFDAHQAYARFMPSPAVELRLGRQVINILNQRLVGGLDFAEQARSFDGARFIYDADDVRFDAAYALVRKAADEPGGVDLLPDGHLHLATLHIGYSAYRALEPHVVGVFEADSGTDLSRMTFGPMFRGKLGKGLSFEYSAEGYLQAGGEEAPESQVETINYLGWLVALRARLIGGRAFKPYVEVGASLISGDEEQSDNTQRVFRAPYPTGHKFHGEMDFFINFPKDTQQRGLRDLYATVGWGTKRVASSVAFHFFDPMADVGGLSHFGYELDFKLRYQFWKHAAVSGVYALFSPGDILRSGKDDPGLEHYGFATVDVRF
jgi:hypothetical protein